MFEDEIALDLGDLRLVRVELDVRTLEHFTDRADRFEPLRDGRNAVHRRHDHRGDRAEIAGQQHDVADADLEESLLVEVGDENQRAEVEQHEEHPVDRTENRIDPVHLKSGVADLLELLVDPADLNLLDVVRAGDRNQADHFGDPAGHVLNALPEGAVAFADLLADRHEEADGKRHGGQVEQDEERRLDQRHDDRDDDRADDMRNRVEQHARHVFDAFDIAGDLVLQRPHSGRGVVWNRQMLKARAERGAQIHFDGTARHAHESHIEHVRRNVLDDHHEADRQNLPEPPDDLLQRQLPVRDQVDHFGGQDRNQKDRRRLDQVHEPDQDEAAFPFGVEIDIVSQRSAVAVLTMQKLSHLFT